MFETAPLWLRLLTTRPVLWAAGGLLIPIVLVWLAVLVLLWLLGWVFHGVRLVGIVFEVNVPDPTRWLRTTLSTGLADALQGWYDEARQRYCVDC